MSSRLLGLVPLALVACPGPIAEGEWEPLVCEQPRTSVNQLQLAHSRDVEILFVIDNSASMAEEQVELNEGVAALFERLDAAEVNYRIGFTTTDNGNPWCPAGVTTPEAGKLVLSPCTERLDDFMFGDSVDVRDFACTEQCSLSPAELEIRPTTTDVDEVPAPRPWIERRAGVSNLPAASDPVEAFKCFAPQGVNGCGFESQLESMYLALSRMQDPGEASYGFLGASSVLAVVILTDEADCSYDKDWAEIFDADGSKAFWSDPEATFPSSAVCWNAGVACTGDPSGYDACEPVNKAADGGEAVAEAAAVLHPLSRYLGLLDGLEQERQTIDPGTEHVLGVIAGVEGGGSSWSVSYANADDPVYQLDFGIGPGCTSADDQAAVPPVRMRALVEAHDPVGLYSICDDDLSAALGDLGDRIVGQFEPLCMTQCVADGDLSTPQFEADCRLIQDPPGDGIDDRTTIPECVRGPDGYLIDPETDDHALPEGADVCMAFLVDPDGSETADPNDDMSAQCSAEGYNLEFAIVRRAGVYVPGGTSIAVDCKLSDCAFQDCPGLW